MPLQLFSFGGSHGRTNLLGFFGDSTKRSASRPVYGSKMIEFMVRTEGGLVVKVDYSVIVPSSQRYGS